jgi:predicted nucleotidyltransferase
MRVANKKEFFDFLLTHKGQLRQYGVKRCGVFGSFARGQQTEESDIDILVEFEPGNKSFDNFMKLAFFLEDMLGRRVELVTPESLSPYIGPRILREVEYASVGS